MPSGAAGPVLSKGVGDSNAAVLDKALEALIEFLQKVEEEHASR